MTFLAQFFSLEAAMLAANIRENERSNKSVHYKKYAYSTLSTLKYWIHLVISYYLELSYKWHLTPYPNQPPPPSFNYIQTLSNFLTIPFTDSANKTEDFK